MKGGLAVMHELDHAGERGVIAQFDGVVADDAIGLTDGGHDLGLFHGVDAEVGFEIEIQIEHVYGISCLLGYESQDTLFDGIGFHSGFQC